MEKHNGPGQQTLNNKSHLDDKDINIVLVGETGVGKSTFINSYANYLKFGSFDEAKTSKEIPCLIRSKFTITDDDFNQFVVCFGNDENESINPGESSTQSARSYRFSFNEMNVRLIDTPGIGDTRGITKDEENFDKLLLMLSELKYVNAFCILLQPNIAKLTASFQYCIKQLLSRLDKSASQNIVFVFTNSRGSFYKPGDTLTPLTLILKDIKDTPPHVEIPFDKLNVFCMDNEAFRFLLASKSNISFSDTERREFAVSWEKSSEVSTKLLEYVRGLSPHKIQNTISINEARRLILNLSEPLAHVSKNIDDNLRNIQKKKSELSDESKSIEELKKNLYFHMIRLKVEDIEYPSTVCTHEDCIDVIIIEGSKHFDYKQVCHERCYCMNNVPQEVVGCSELKKCTAMNPSLLDMILKKDPTCKRCRHTYKHHMHIYYRTQPYSSREINKDVDSNIKKKEQILLEIENVIQELQGRITELEEERDIIQTSMAKFAYFLNRNAITPYNDKYEEYIKYLIYKEKSQGHNIDWNLIEAYENIIRTYKNKKDILDAHQIQTDSSNVISTEYILELVQNLYKLKTNGELIEMLFKTQQKHRQCEALLFTEKNVDTVDGWYKGSIK